MLCVDDMSFLDDLFLVYPLQIHKLELRLY